jgi:trans-aconitate 2-methyltransferase
MTAWSPGQYLKFADERTRPARDLLAAVPLAQPRRVVDLGCGPGNSTELLAARFPEAAVSGIDSSPEMLAAARKRLPALSFVEVDATTWTPEAETDLVFANAVFHWVPDHRAVMARLLAALPAGGALAVQMPDNLDEPSHRLMRHTALDGPWRDRFDVPIAREVLFAPPAYYDALRPLAARVDIWRTIYNHPVEGAAAMLEWVRSTGLRPYLDRLTPDERPVFEADYVARLADAYPALADGKVLFRFPRLFIVAVRA